MRLSISIIIIGKAINGEIQKIATTMTNVAFWPDRLVAIFVLLSVFSKVILN